MTQTALTKYAAAAARTFLHFDPHPFLRGTSVSVVYLCVFSLTCAGIEELTTFHRHHVLSTRSVWQCHRTVSATLPTAYRMYRHTNVAGQSVGIRYSSLQKLRLIFVRVCTVTLARNRRAPYVNPIDLIPQSVGINICGHRHTPLKLRLSPQNPTSTD